MKARLSLFCLVLLNRIVVPGWRLLVLFLLLYLSLPASMYSQIKLRDKSFGGSNYDQLNSVQQTSDGGYILGGSSSSGISDDKSGASKGRDDYWVVQRDNSSINFPQKITFAPILYKRLNDAPFPLLATSISGLPVTFSAVSGPATINGSILSLTGTGAVTVKASVAGNATYLPAEATQSFLVKAASVVKKEWDKTLGGDNKDFLNYVQQTRDGGYILGGTSISGISGDKSQEQNGVCDGEYCPSDYWLVKLKADGSKEWDKTIGGDGEDHLSSLQQTSDGGYILGGSSASGSSGDKSEGNKGLEDYWVLKLDNKGNKVWDKTIGGSDTELLSSVQQTRDGGYILGGTSSKLGIDEDGYPISDFWVVKLNAEGQKVWDKTLGGDRNDQLASVQQTNDGGYILGGTSGSASSGDKSQASKDKYDYWIVKLNDDGSKAWDKTFGGSNDDFLAFVQQTSEGGYILGGTSESGSSSDKSEASKGGNDYWIVKVNANGVKIWDQTLGTAGLDYLAALRQARDGGYILGGSSDFGINGDKTHASRGERDYWVVKLEANGTKVWDRTIGGNRNDELTTLQQTSDDGYILGGYSESGVSGDKSEASKGYVNYWIVKIKEEQPLTTQWNLRYGGAGIDNFTSVIKTSDGGYLSSGFSVSGSSGDKSQTSQGQNDYWIVKSDKNGKQEWDRRYGGAANDYLNRVIQTQDGGYLLGGSSLSGKRGNKSEEKKGQRDYWVVKVDAQGNQQWDKAFGGSGYNELKKVIQLASGEYVLGGYSDSPISGDKTQKSRGGTDYWLVKISANGAKLWDKCYGGNLDELFGSFTQTRDGGFFLGGSSLSGKSGDKSQASQGAADYWAVKTDKAGNLLWEKAYGGSGQEEAFSVRRSHGDNLYLAGTSESNISGDKSQKSQGGKDYWLIKLDEQGTKLWDRTFGGSQDDELRASTYTEEGHYYLAGYSYSGASGDKTQDSQGGSDYWVVGVAANGEKIADQRYGGSGQDELRTLFQTNDGGLLLGGRSDSDVSGDRTQPSQGGTDYWLVKVAPLTTTTPMVAAREATLLAEPVKLAESINVSAYPNPVRDKATVSFTVPEKQFVQLKVYDSQGRVVATLFQGQAQANQTYQVEWKASHKVTGMYLLQLQTPTKRQQYKVLLNR